MKRNWPVTIHVELTTCAVTCVVPSAVGMVNGAVVIVNALMPPTPSAPGTETVCGVAQQDGWQGVGDDIKIRCK